MKITETQNRVFFLYISRKFHKKKSQMLVKFFLSKYNDNGRLIMKKHNTFKVVLITILVLVLLTWILPAAYYSGSYIDQGRVQMGIFDLFNYPVTAISYFGYIAMYVLIVGGFYGVLNKIGAYRTMLDKLVSKFKGKEVVVLSIMMVLISILTSVCGLQLGLVIFFPMIISLILLMGYDKIVAALAIVGSTMIGMLGTTYGYNNTGIIPSILGNSFADQILVKSILLFLGMVLLIFNTIWYIKKSKSATKKANVKKVEAKEEKKTTKTTKSTKNSKTKSSQDTKAAVKEEKVIVVTEDNEEESYVPATISGKKHVVWPLALILFIIFVILVLAFVSWSGAFGLTAMEDAKTAVTTFEVFGFALFGKLLGTVNAFGSWSLVDISAVLMVFMLILALIYKVKFNEVIDGFIAGAKRALGPAVIVILLYTILVITTYHPFQLVIYKAILGITDGFNVFTTFVVAILSALFNVDPAYAFQSSLPYFASIVTNADNYPIVAVVYQAAYGLTMLVAPTSLVLMGMLSYLKIPYGKWFKTIWKLLLELLVLLLIVFTILILI